MKTFREAVCQRFDISPEAYEQEVLWRCFYPPALALGRILWHLCPVYFDADLDLIQQVADCNSASEVRLELNDHRYHQPPKGLARRFLRIRLSGRRLVDLAALVMQ